MGERHRPIRARSAPGQVAGAATETARARSPSSKPACPTAFSTTRIPLCPVSASTRPDRGSLPLRIFMPRDAAATRHPADAKDCIRKNPPVGDREADKPGLRYRVEACAGDSRAEIANPVAHAPPALTESTRPDLSDRHPFLACAPAQERASERSVRRDRIRGPAAVYVAGASPRSRSPGDSDAVVVRRAKQSSRAVLNTGLALPLADTSSHRLVANRDCPFVAWEAVRSRLLLAGFVDPERESARSAGPSSPPAGTCGQQRPFRDAASACDATGWSYTQKLWMRVKRKAAYLPG